MNVSKKLAVLALASVFTISSGVVSAAETYRIATEGAYAPYNYLAADGSPDGYDIAVAKAVDELLPEIEFTYQAVEWSAIFAGLEAERYDLIVSEAAKTPERTEKYLFGDVPYNWSVGGIAFKKGRSDITGLESLKGKSVTVAVGSSNASIIEQWNQAHNGEVNVVYGDGEISKALLEVQEGRVDATLVNPPVARLVIREQGLDVNYSVRDDARALPIYWLFTKDAKGEKLKAAVDSALKVLHENGTLKRLSEQYLGADYTTESAAKSVSGK